MANPMLSALTRAELQSTDRTLRDVVALSTLPAVWSGAEPQRIAEMLAASLFTTLDPALVYVGFTDDAGNPSVAVAQTDRDRTSPLLAEQFGPAILNWARTHDPDDLLELEHPAGALKHPAGAGSLQVTARSIGFHAEWGVVAAAYSGGRTPSPDQHLLLNIAATQAASAIQNARLVRSARDSAAEAQTLHEVSLALAGEVDLQKLVQTVTDASTRLTSAKFGGFFYNVTNDQGEAYLLYTLSGAPREALENFGLPRNTPVFDPTFRGTGVVRCDDITRDPRYGTMAPHYGQPKGHLPVRSYLAVPVISRSGEVIGGLFFGHPEIGVFTERAERLAIGIAAQASIAIDNARLLAQREQGERRFRQMTDALPAAVYTTDAQGRLTYFNPACVELSGRTPDLGTDHWCVTWRLYHPDGTPLPHDQCPMALALKEGRAVRGAEAVAERHDGTRICFAAYPTPLFDEAGKLVGGINMLVDITERKQAEEAMRKSEQRFRELVEQCPFGMYIVDSQFRIAQMNAGSQTGAFRNVWPVIGRDFADSVHILWPEPVAQQIIAVFRHTLATGEPYYSKDFVNPRDDINAVESYEWELHRITLPDGQHGVVCYYYDSTKLREAEHAIRYRAKQFETLVNQAPLGVYLVDADFRIAQVNPVAQPVFGDIPGGVVGRDLAEVIHLLWDEPYADEVVRIFRHTLASGEPYVTPQRTEYRVDRQVWEYYEWRLDRITLPDGRYGLVCYFRDISQQVQARDALELARQAAESASAAKDRFLAVLSHELRTPLSPVVMTIPAIEIDPDLPYKFRDDLAMVRRNIDLEVKLIDDLLDLSRVTSGKLHLQMQPVHVHELWGHVLRSSESETSAKRLNVRCELTAGDDRLMGDPARLQQVFWNLLRNAVKFTPEAGDVTIRTWNAPDDGHLCVEVRDSGVGIEPEVLPRIFDAFEQGDARMTHQFGGLGLGLAIAKAVVELHGGRISAASDGRGRGAAFTVVLKTAPATSAHPPHADLPHGAAERPPGRSRVLLVEDHPDTVRALAKLLKLSGFEVKTATSVAAALQLAAAETFDVIVSDIGLPDATGYELMEQIRDRYGTKGIALSGYGMEDDMRRSREAGFVDHVVKPVNLAQLQAVIQRVTGNGPNGNPRRR